MAVSPTNLVQGKVLNEADSSAVFRVAHDASRLLVDVIVKDDIVVSNIAPNDIRGPRSGVQGRPEDWGRIGLE